MRVGVGLPATLPGVTGDVVIEWARRADEGPFSSLGIFDRVLYDNYEPLVTLGAAAAVTRRVKLVTSVLIAPLRNPIIAAKGAATLQALSGGRLVLGVGLGARSDDYERTGAPYRTRGRALSDALATIHEVWEDEAIGPKATGKPTVLVGGAGGLAMTRTIRYADGYIHNGGPPRAFARSIAEVKAAWEDAERPGVPQLWGMAYWAFGDIHAGADYLKDYYAFTGPFADRIAAGLLTTPDAVREFVRDYDEVGCDELLLFPAFPHLDELDRLAEVLGR